MKQFRDWGIALLERCLLFGTYGLGLSLIGIILYDIAVTLGIFRV